MFEDEGEWIELRERFARQEIEALVDAVYERMAADQPQPTTPKPWASKKRRREQQVDHDRATIVRTVLALWEFLQEESHEELLVRRCLNLQDQDPRPHDEFPS